MKIIEVPTTQIPDAKPQEMWLSKDGFEPVPEGAKTVKPADQICPPAIQPIPPPVPK